MQEILFSTAHHVVGLLQDADHLALKELLRRCPDYADCYPIIPPSLLGIGDLRGNLIGILDASEQLPCSRRNGTQPAADRSGATPKRHWH